MKEGLLLLVALVLLAPRAEPAWSIYNRPVADVMWAIGQSQPTMSSALRRSYAETILKEGRSRRFDSFTLVAIGNNESRWNASLVGGARGKCHGIGQHCVHLKYSYCKGELYESERCKKKRAWLLNGNNNIIETASDITSWRKYVRKMTGHSALFHRWLQGYQGFNKPKQGIICGMRKVRGRWVDLKVPALTKRVMNYRKKLIRLNARRRR